jgi:ADP-ribosylglycohydrolase
MCTFFVNNIELTALSVNECPDSSIFNKKERILIMSLRDIFAKFKNKNNNATIPDKTQESNAIAPPFAMDTTTISLDEAIKLYTPDFIPGQRVMNKEDLKKHILYAVALGDISGSQYEGVPYPGQDVQEIISSASKRSTSDANLNGGAYPVYEGYKTIDMFTEFNHITDDTVLTVAIYKATQKIKASNTTDKDEIVQIYTDYLRKYHNAYPNAGYAGGFDDWACSDTDRRNFSYGNGSCMRVGGIAVLFDVVEDVIRYAYYSALPSHSHAEGIKGAICTSVIYWMLSFGATKDDVLKYIQKQYPADNGRDINSATTLEKLVDMNRINPWSTLSVICQTSLVEAVINFIESDSFESCLRNSYRYLCDRDTISAIAAPMAAIYYKDMSVGRVDGEEIVNRYFDDKLLNDING